MVCRQAGNLGVGILEGVNTGDTYDDGFTTGGGLIAIPFLANGTDVGTLQVFTGENNDLHSLDLYTVDPATGEPDVSLGSCSWETVEENQWQGCFLPTPVALSAGTPYFVVWDTTSGSQSSLQAGGLGTATPYYGSNDGGATWNGPFTFYDMKARGCSPGGC